MASLAVFWMYFLIVETAGDTESVDFSRRFGHLHLHLPHLHVTVPKHPCPHDPNVNCFYNCPNLRPEPRYTVVRGTWTIPSQGCYKYGDRGAGSKGREPTKITEGNTYSTEGEEAEEREVKGGRGPVTDKIESCSLQRKCHRDEEFLKMETFPELALSVLISTADIDEKPRRVLQWTPLILNVLKTRDGRISIYIPVSDTYNNGMFNYTTRLVGNSVHVFIQAGTGKAENKNEVMLKTIYVNKELVWDGLEPLKYPIGENTDLYPNHIRLGYPRTEDPDTNVTAVPFVGTYYMVDIFDTHFNKSYLKEYEFQYVDNLLHGRLYPECVCGRRRPAKNLTCEDHSNRLTGEPSTSKSMFVSERGLSDGIIKPDLNYGYWITNETSFSVRLETIALVTCVELYLKKQTVTIIRDSSGMWLQMRCPNDTTHKTCQRTDDYHSYQWESVSTSTPYERFVWRQEVGDAPILTKAFHIQFEEVTSGGNVLYEMVVLGRPWDQVPTPERCVCFPGNGLPYENCSECGQCQCREGNWTLAGLDCSPYVVEVVPDYGPSIGGTVITLYGVMLKPYPKDVRSTDAIASIGSLLNSRQCRTTFHNDSMVVCEILTRNDTQRATNIDIPQDIRLQVFVDEHPFQIDLLQNFTFYEDPVISAIKPHAIFIGEETDLHMYGTGFDEVRNRNNILFTINIGAIDQTRSEVCDIKTDDLMVCHLPSIPIKDTRVESVFYADLGVDLDGMITYRNLSSSGQQGLGPYPIYRRPVMSYFTEKKLVKTSETLLFIEGKHLKNNLCGNGNFTVTLGSTPCPVTVIEMQRLGCKIPSGLLASMEDQELLTVNAGGCGVEMKDVGSIRHKKEVLPSTVSAIAGISACTFIIVLLTIIITILIRRWRRRKEEEEKEYASREGYQRLLRENPEDPEEVLCLLEDTVKAAVQSRLIEASRLRVQRELGKGNFGKVYHGLLQSNGGDIDVAVKTLKDDENVGTLELQEFLGEATIMKDFKHNHVLSLLGVVISEGRVFVILPFMANGDLRTYVSKRPFKLGLYLRFILDVAKGMEYLAENKFIHRDLAARNCMVSSGERVLIADFGLARDIHEKDYYRPEDKERPLPFKWMALETLQGRKFSSQADVWSFGVLTWEVLSQGRKPYAHINNFQLPMYLKRGYRLEQPDSCPDPMYSLMSACWLKVPDARPTFPQLVREMKALFNAHSGGLSDADEPDYIDRPMRTAPSASVSNRPTTANRLPTSPEVKKIHPVDTTCAPGGSAGQRPPLDLPLGQTPHQTQTTDNMRTEPAKTGPRPVGRDLIPPYAIDFPKDDSDISDEDKKKPPLNAEPRPSTSAGQNGKLDFGEYFIPVDPATKVSKEDGTPKKNPSECEQQSQLSSQDRPNNEGGAKGNRIAVEWHVVGGQSQIDLIEQEHSDLGKDYNKESSCQQVSDPHPSVSRRESGFDVDNFKPVNPYATKTGERNSDRSISGFPTDRKQEHYMSGASYEKLLSRDETFRSSSQMESERISQGPESIRRRTGERSGDISYVTEEHFIRARPFSDTASDETGQGQSQAPMPEGYIRTGRHIGKGKLPMGGRSGFIKGSSKLGVPSDTDSTSGGHVKVHELRVRAHADNVTLFPDVASKGDNVTISMYDTDLQEGNEGGAVASTETSAPSSSKHGYVSFTHDNPENNSGQKQDQRLLNVLDDSGSKSLSSWYDQGPDASRPTPKPRTSNKGTTSAADVGLDWMKLICIKRHPSEVPLLSESEMDVELEECLSYKGSQSSNESSVKSSSSNSVSETKT